MMMKKAQMLPYDWFCRIVFIMMMSCTIAVYVCSGQERSF